MSRVSVSFDDAGEVAEYTLAPESDLSQFWKAVRLSPAVGVCEALLRGESVPLDRLDRAAVLRYGRRP